MSYTIFRTVSYLSDVSRQEVGDLQFHSHVVFPKTEEDFRGDTQRPWRVTAGAATHVHIDLQSICMYFREGELINARKERDRALSVVRSRRENSEGVGCDDFKEGFLARNIASRLLCIGNYSHCHPPILTGGIINPERSQAHQTNGIMSKS